MTSGTTLGDLLALQLHLFEEEVRNIVDKAVKEMAIEKVKLSIKIHCISNKVNVFYTKLSIYCTYYCLLLQVLTEISQTWAKMEFSYESHHRTSVPLLKCDVELIDTLEDHQVNDITKKCAVTLLDCKPHYSEVEIYNIK